MRVQVDTSVFKLNYVAFSPQANYTDVLSVPLHSLYNQECASEIQK
jgi:hypothetical protein